MALASSAVNGPLNIHTLRNSGVSEVDQKVEMSKDYDYYKTCFTTYADKRTTLLNLLNKILDKTYSFGSDGLPIETIFDENALPNSNSICNAGKKAYAYYLKEVLQKLNYLNQCILKGQEALNGLNTCTDEGQIENYKTILDIQDGLIKKYLDDFNKYTVVQTLTTTRNVVRVPIGKTKPESVSSVSSVEINYAIKGKIWDENGNLITAENEETPYLEEVFKTKLKDLAQLRELTTVKEKGLQFITTTLTNKRTGNATTLNAEFGFNVVDKTISIDPTKEEDSTPIALFDELTLLEKLKYIHVYYNNRNDYPYALYHYPEDLKSSVPCMSRDELLLYVDDTNNNKNNNDELKNLGIIPQEQNKPKTDLVEPGAIELFYVGYLGNSMGAINALAAFMEVKSVAMLAQITQQSYRIKALKTYLKMLEFALQELNSCYEGNTISTKAYLAIKYAAANQTRTLVNINGDDYIVLQKDGGQHENHNISKNNAYIYVKATEEGIREFLGMEYIFVNGMLDFCKEFKDLSKSEIISAYDNGTRFYSGISCSGNPMANYNYLYTQAEIGSYYTIEDDGNRYRVCGNYFINQNENWTHSDNIDHHRMIENKKRKRDGELYDNFYYNAKIIVSPTTLTYSTGNILFAKFNDNTEAIKHLPKELETVKVSMSNILDDNFGAVGINWQYKNNEYPEQWRSFVEMWQNVCQTATENIGSQIESVNKTIKSLRSKIDTFDSSASRFRDKFYSTTMTVLNKIS